MLGRPQCLPCAFARAMPDLDPLLDHRALELGEYAHHLKHGLAGGRRGVEALLVQE